MFSVHAVLRYTGVCDVCISARLHRADSFMLAAVIIDTSQLIQQC
jgi:hypothetical protein